MKHLYSIVFVIILLTNLQYTVEAITHYDNSPIDWDNTNTTRINMAPIPNYNSNATILNTHKLNPTEIYEKNVNSVVYIEIPNGQGSGVIVKEDGTFITCFHVIENADYITIKTHDGRAFKVNGFKYINPTEDIAILTIDASYNKFTPIDINYKSLQIGEKVYTISNPKGLEFTFSDGMINQYKNEYIQFSAPISPGSSGGALLNENGQLIGIITSYLGKAQNINFALPNDYYVSRINNLTIRNTYNQNWTKFLLSQTDNSQFKISTDYDFSDSESLEVYYNRLKDYVDLPNFPSDYYAIVGTLALCAYVETQKNQILKDSIKWFELSIKNDVNIELSLYSLALLYIWDSDKISSSKCLKKLQELYPESFKIIQTMEINLNKKIKTYFNHLEKLINKAVDAAERRR